MRTLLLSEHNNCAIFLLLVSFFVYLFIGSSGSNQLIHLHISTDHTPDNYSSRQLLKRLYVTAPTIIVEWYAK